MLVKLPDRWCLTKWDTHCWYTLDIGGSDPTIESWSHPWQSLTTPIRTLTYGIGGTVQGEGGTFTLFEDFGGDRAWSLGGVGFSDVLLPSLHFDLSPPQVSQNISNELGTIRNDIHSHIWPPENFPFVYQYHPQNFKVFVTEDVLAVITNTQYSNELPAFSSQRVSSKEWLQGFPLELLDKFIIS